MVGHRQGAVWCAWPGSRSRTGSPSSAHLTPDNRFQSLVASRDWSSTWRLDIGQVNINNISQSSQTPAHRTDTVECYYSILCELLVKKLILSDDL